MPTIIRKVAAAAPLAAILLASAPAARAQGRDLSAEPQIAFLSRLANQYFPVEPHCDRLEIVEEVPRTPGAVAGTVPCTNGRRVGVIRLDPTWVSWDEETLCETIAHEWAHLGGIRHTDDPRDLMYTHAVEGTAVFGPCDRIGAAVGLIADLDYRLGRAFTRRDELRQERVRSARASRRRKTVVARLGRRCERLTAQRHELERVVGPGWIYSHFRLDQ